MKAYVGSLGSEVNKVVKGSGSESVPSVHHTKCGFFTLSFTRLFSIVIQFTRLKQQVGWV